MSSGRVMGVETEFGISVPGNPNANPMILSGEVVLAYARIEGPAAHRVRWDYAGETPLSDARGLQVPRRWAHPSQLTDEAADDPTIANTVLTNGARLYVDHAHPEYSSPEVTTVLEALVYDRAGEQLMAEAVARLAERAAQGAGPAVNLYKNNTDGKGSSYGTHENYLVDRAVPFGRLAAQLIPFFVARQVVCGAGRVGLGQSSQRPGFQISSRADFFEAEVGLETTFRRPIVNTRDEPHADPDRYRRLHVILGDANLCDVANLLKLGSTSLVLGLIEADLLGSDLQVSRPVEELRAVSHDPGLNHLITLADGRRMTGLDLVALHYERCRAHLDRLLELDLIGPEQEALLVLQHWEQVVDDLRTDPGRCADRIDWVAKLAVLEGFQRRDQVGWDDPRLAAVDIQWSDVRPDKGLARRLEAQGRIVRLTEPDQVDRAMTHPPESTRAWFRGECVRRFRGQVTSASWESVVFDLPSHAALQRVPILEPLRGTRELTAGLLAASTDAEDLLRRLRGAAHQP